MGLLSLILLGLVAGWLAGMIMRGGGYGILGDIVLGILGALIGGFLTSVFLGVNMVDGFDVTSILVAMIGAIVLIALSRALTPHRSTHY
jgi:uncharacterized membrane protein YeaQ/YmgE (transglycosylase-associated protein family)